ncbi:hypothetical protein LUCX_288 [Xanthomonas phage vB_XciM_LucasX]|nr:hypothetical protein LUCX_288 [Xanthomonas phage vB_XciM_LucasX]
MSRNDLINNPPTVFRVDIDPELAELTPLFTGYVMDMVANMSQRNAARNMFYELAQSDNSILPEMAQDLATLTEFCVFTENTRPNQIHSLLHELVQVVVNGYLVMAVEKFPEQFNPTISQDMVNDLEGYLSKYQQAMQQARNYVRGGGGRQPVGGRGYGNQSFQGGRSYGGNGGRTSYGGGGNAGGSWQPGGGGRSYGGAATGRQGSRWDQVDDQGNLQAGTQGGHYNPTGMRYRPTGKGMWAEEQNGRQPGAGGARFHGGGGVGRQARVTVDAPEQQAPMGRRGPVVPDNATVVDGITFVPAVPGRQWPKVVNPERRWDHILLDNGVQMRPAFNSPWTLSFDPATPAVPYYDPGTEILFHVKEQDKVTWKLFTWDNSMEYLKHEMDPNLRRREQELQQRKEGKVRPNWELAKDLRPTPSSPLATSEPLNAETRAMEVKSVNDGNFMQTTSLADAVKKSSYKLRVETPELFKKPFELYVDRAVLTTEVNVDFGQMYEMTNAQSFQDLWSKMGDLESELLSAVDARITQGINQALKQNLSIPSLDIDSFYGDWADLRDVLLERYGEPVVEALESAAPEVIFRWLSHYEESEIEEVAALLDIEAEHKALIWSERTSVTCLPFSAADLNLPADGVMVSAAVNPEVYSTLLALMARTADWPHVYFARYLTTNDGQVFSVVKGYLNDEALMIYKTDIVLK